MYELHILFSQNLNAGAQEFLALELLHPNMRSWGQFQAPGTAPNVTIDRLDLIGDLLPATVAYSFVLLRQPAQSPSYRLAEKP